MTDSDHPCCETLKVIKQEIDQLRYEVGHRHNQIIELWKYNKITDLQAADALDNLVRSIMGPLRIKED